MAKKSFGKQAADLASTERKPTSPEKPKEARLRTNVTLAASTILAMRRMQDQGLMEGQKLTYSELIDEGIALLAKERGVDV